MLEKVQLEKVLFLDIETVPQVKNFNDFSENGKKQFILKNKFKINSISQDPKFSGLDENAIYEEVFHLTGGILAEFGKIICITVGFVRETKMGKQLRLKSYFHDDEETLLKGFCKLLEDNYNTPYSILCGHNAKEFDIPYICRRILINALKLPNILDIAGKKPWEISHLDTMELWKFGDFKAYTSLSLLCHVFDIPTPKDDISGADVARVYYENEKDIYKSGLERIKVYCEKDVLALVQLFLKMRGDALIDETNIEIV